MKRLLNLILIPFLLFVALLAIYLTVGLVFWFTRIIGSILKGMMNWIFSSLPEAVMQTVSDPWRVIAFPIAIGAVIVLYWWISQQGDEGDNFLRGRRLDESQPSEGRYWDNWDED